VRIAGSGNSGDNSTAESKPSNLLNLMAQVLIAFFSVSTKNHVVIEFQSDYYRHTLLSGPWLTGGWPALRVP
jgi:hypothetical protein